MLKHRLLAGLVLTGSLALVSVPAHAAAATPAACGQTLSGDFYLAADLTCAGNGLTITADLKLDLRGHRLTSSGGGSALTVVGSASPTIVSGSIRGWTAGITTDQVLTDGPAPTRTVRFDRVAFVGNGTAIDASNTSSQFYGYQQTDFVVRDSRFNQNGVAIGGTVTGLLDVDHSHFTHNGQAASVTTGSISIRNSLLYTNDAALVCDESACELRNDKIRHSPNAITTKNLAGLTLSHTVISNSDVALQATETFGMQVDHTTFIRNKTAVTLTQGFGTFSRNWFSRNTTAYTTDGQSDDDGVAVLDRNEFRGNGDAISTTESGTSLKRNLAVRNRGYGIYAPKAVDLGGNRAYGNGKSPQCTGVSCAKS